MTDSQNNTPTPDDPMLTAFALGELEPGSDDYRRIESLITSDADARTHVEQIRALGTQLSSSYSTNQSAPLSDSQQQSIANAIDAKPGLQLTQSKQPNTPSAFRLPRPLLIAAGLAIAATAAITTVSLMGPNNQPDPIKHADDAAPPVTGLAAITKALDTPVAVDFDNAPLSEVLVYIHKQTGVGITTDWDALEKRGVDRSTPVSLKAEKPQPASSLINAALQLAWAQSPHPDPAQWTMTDDGVGIAPKSKLVQSRLDATAKLLADRRFSKAPVTASLTRARYTKVWDTSLWNDIQDKREEAGQVIIDEAQASLSVAERELKEDNLEAAAEQALYAYHLMASNAALLPRDAIDTPFERLANLRESVAERQLELDKAAIAQTVEHAKANDTELGVFDSSMLAASEALSNQSFQAAVEAVNLARIELANQFETMDKEELSQKLGLLNRLQVQIYGTMQDAEQSQLVKIEKQLKQLEGKLKEEVEVRRVEEVRSRITEARQLQQHGQFDKAQSKLDEAMALEPTKSTIKSLRDIVADKAVISGEIAKRGHDLQVANQQLLNIEANTPYADALTYPGAWPELTAQLGAEEKSKKLGDVKWKGSLGWQDGHTSYGVAPGHDFNSRYAYTLPGSNAPLAGRRNDLWHYQGRQIEGRTSKSAYLGDATNGSLQLYAKPGLVTPPPPTAPVTLDYVTNYYFRGYEQSAAVDKDSDRGGGNISGVNTFGLVTNRPGKPASQPAKLSIKAGVKIAETERLERGRGTVDSRYRENLRTYYNLYDQKSGDKANKAQRNSLAKVIVDEGPIPTEPHSSLTRKEQLEWQRQQINLTGNQPIEEAEQAEIISKLSEEDRKKLDSEFDERINRAVVTEQSERRRIEVLQQLSDLERRFIEETRAAMTEDPIMSRDAYALVNDNPFYNPAEPGRTLSTFSVDVDTAAYSIVRKKLMDQNQLPVAKAVRIEEMINYFDYGYKAPAVDGRALEDGVVTQASLEKFEKENEGFAPFATDIQVTDCPWQVGNQIVRIGIQGMDVTQDQRPDAHLTFLLDVSGSMNSANKLPLVKQSIKLLLDKLNATDRVSLVVYAGRTATVLENASAADRGKIENALDNLKAGGSTAGAAGITLAYEAAQKHFIDGGVNRVILCTDGDFNVGIRDKNELVSLIKEKANPKADADGKKRGVYLSVLGYGMGNLNDAMMEPLTNAGNGNYAFIDTVQEAQKVMYDQAGATLVAIAKDVKVQVQFDPEQVLAYRLIGYENRVLANEDFANDKVDAGDIGAGHSVTALYEVVPFDGIDGLQDDDAIREVRHQIDELDEAIALNQTMMYTVALSDSDRVRLTGATRLLSQERVLADAALGVLAKKQAGHQPGKANATERLVPNEEPDANGEADKQPAVQAEPVEPLQDGAMLAVRLRYKPVDAPAEDGTSRLIETPIFADQAVPFAQADEPTRFAASVAGFGMLLRSSPHAGDATVDWVIETAEQASQHDPHQRRAEFIKIVKKAKPMMPQPKPAVDENVIR